MVPFVKIQGETNTADLMTKHLVGPILLKHVKNLKLVIREGRSEQAAKLHSISTTTSTTTTTTTRRGESSQASSRSLPGGDFWAEHGEHGRWVRVHVNARSSMFYPEEASRGPGRKTRLRATRKVQGIYLSGERFKTEGDWTTDNNDDEHGEE